MNSAELQPIDCPEYFNKYIDLLGSVDLLECLQQSKDHFITFMQSIPQEQYNFSYEQGKWSIGEVVQHLIDGERVFQYRALCFARNPGTILEGYDHDVFAENAKRTLAEKKQLLEHYDVVRSSTIKLFESFSKEELLNRGILIGNSVSVAALGFFSCGHQKHHLNIIEERYLR
ncbi:DinB family protein [Galbibacter sp.]|jgi:uncharacterized damage-inducible protein DinB|uniref:DinB family protein n=1 Tax=Galbibacter sp. TaxID=2918471 RepID=UPI003A8F67AF